MRARVRVRVRAEGDRKPRAAAGLQLPRDLGWENTFIQVSTPKAQMGGEK